MVSLIAWPSERKLSVTTWNDVREAAISGARLTQNDDDYKQGRNTAYINTINALILNFV